MAFTNVGPSVTSTNNPQSPFSNLAQIALLTASLAPTSVAANTTAEQTFAVTGLLTTDVVFVNKPTFQAGIAIGNVRVSAVNTLAVTYVNDTAGSITPTTESYALIVGRPQPFIATTLPTTMPLL